MAALVQTLPQQTGTVPMLQTRPSSASGTFAAPSQATHQPSLRAQPASRNAYNPVSGSGNHRGHQAMPTVAPYAFTSTPGLATPESRQSFSPLLRPESRSTSAPSSVPRTAQKPSSSANAVNPPRLQPPAAGSVSSASSNSSLHSYVSKDDTALPTRQRTSDLAPRPLSTVNLPTSSAFLNISSPTIASKPSPDRYRRGNRRPENAAGAQAVYQPSDPSSSSTSSFGTLPPLPGPGRTTAGHVRVSSADDTRSEKSQRSEPAKRYRRRSWAGLDTTGLVDLRNQMNSQAVSLVPASDPKPREGRPRSHSSHSHNDSTESVSSTRSSNRSAVSDPGTIPSVPPPREDNTALRPSDIPKRQSSPLSNQVTMGPASPVTDSPAPHDFGPDTTPPRPGTSATQRLAEINRSEQKKSGRSRLRRAFSFGSAADLRRATGEKHGGKKEGTEPEKTRRQQLSEELGAEQAAIAEQQEASGLGENIYSGHFFSGSTDNLSVSSTASSASMMLRKMGKGMKKSTRSFVGLFRSKSLIKHADKKATVPQVSVVNVEAEGVTANADPHDQRGGGTVFTKLGSSQGNASKPSSLRSGSSVDNPRARKSIAGGEKERAEVLAAVRKGILKRPGTDSGNSSPSVHQNGELGLPHAPHSNDSPHSSAPSTPDDQSSRRKRADSVKIEGEDYFLSVGKYPGQEAKTASVTPQPVVKNIVFSPRIQFHETWPSGEYDRRGDIATCNRLTPLLAQQIKEELNNFKMEMEVHETSKVYTHFL
ncbi:hypothetical protein VTN02DRAFT_6816 [Thermoascus thermophilus]